MEVIAENYPISSNATYPLIETPNIVVDALVADTSSFDGGTFYVFRQSYGRTDKRLIEIQASSGIQLPSNLLLDNFQGNSTIGISVIFYKSNIMFRDEILEGRTGSLPSNEVIAVNVRGLHSQELSQPVQLQFRLFDTPVLVRHPILPHVLVILN